MASRSADETIERSVRERVITGIDALLAVLVVAPPLLLRSGAGEALSGRFNVPVIVWLAPMALLSLGLLLVFLGWRAREYRRPMFTVSRLVVIAALVGVFVVPWRSVWPNPLRAGHERWVLENRQRLNACLSQKSAGGRGLTPVFLADSAIASGWVQSPGALCCGATFAGTFARDGRTIHVLVWTDAPFNPVRLTILGDIDGADLGEFLNETHVDPIRLDAQTAIAIVHTN